MWSLFTLGLMVDFYSLFPKPCKILKNGAVPGAVNSKMKRCGKVQNFEDDNFCQTLLKFDITNSPLSKINDTVLSVLEWHAKKKKKKK